MEFVRGEVSGLELVRTGEQKIRWNLCQCFVFDILQWNGTVCLRSEKEMAYAESATND